MIKISVRAHPNSSQTKVEVDANNTYHVFVQEPANKNRANQAIIKLLANYLNLKKNQIFFESGETEKNKVFVVMKKIRGLS